MAKCTIVWDKNVQAYKLTFPYNVKAVEFLKKLVPNSERIWDNQTKTWTFNESYLQGTIDFCRLCFGGNEVAVLTRQQVEQASQQAPPGMPVHVGTGLGADAIEFLKLIPFDIMKKAYRETAHILHPDKNKDDESKMATFNSYWTKIEKGVYGR